LSYDNVVIDGWGGKDYYQVKTEKSRVDAELHFPQAAYHDFPYKSDTSIPF